jgi:hypothetical protein
LQFLKPWNKQEELLFIPYFLAVGLSLPSFIAIGQQRNQGEANGKQKLFFKKYNK